MTKMLTKEEAGRSMVEMLGVLAIVGVLSIGGISGYSKAMAKYKVNQTLDQISMLVTNIRSTFGNQASYESLSNTVLVTYGLVDNDMSHGKTDGTLKNAYGGTITVSTADSNLAFTVKYENVPTNACANIASSNWGDSAASGLVSITIGTNNAHNWSSTGQSSLPIGFAQAASECSDTSKGASGGYTTITWKYY